MRKRPKRAAADANAEALMAQWAKTSQSVVDASAEMAAAANGRTTALAEKEAAELARRGRQPEHQHDTG